MERAAGRYHRARLMPPAPLVLGSASKGRRWLLKCLVDTFSCEAPDVDERQIDETPRQLVERLAIAKARAVRQRLGHTGLVLGGDTVMARGTRVFGKPLHAEAAAEMLRALSGREHSALSGVALVADNWQRSLVRETHITLHTLDEAQIRAYCALGEGLDKAGGYALQGRGAAFVRQMSGSVSGVLGLPLCATRELLFACGAS